MNCGLCGKTLHRDTPEELLKMEEEYRREFPKAAAAEVSRAIVCDVCFRAMEHIVPRKEWDDIVHD